MNRLKDTYKHMAAVASALLLALSVLPACSDDEGGGPGEEEGFATLVVSLQASSNSEPIGTRAAGDPTVTEEEENDYERKIENWWVLIYNNDGFVDYLSNRKQSSATTPSGDDSEFSTSIKLPVGAYRLYGFANLNSVNDADEFLQLLEGGAIDESDLVANRNSLAGQAININNVLERFNVSSDTRPSIPMSSYSESVSLSANEQNTVTLELYRMIGKVRVEITNQTGEDIDLDGLSMSFFRTTGDIFLMPYTGLDEVGTDVVMSNTMAPIFPTGSTSGYKEYKYPVAENEKIAVNTKGKYSFYVPETPLEGQANNGASPMTITFNVPQKNGENTRETVFDFVRRNDLLKIGATLANINSKLVYSNRNMPIGGIPETIWQTKNGIQINIPIQVVASHTGPIEIQYELSSISNYDVDNIPSIANLMEASISDRYINTKEVILHHKENVDLIPANLDLSAISLSLVSAMSREYTLKNCLKDIRKDYDYILIDCNPSLDMLTLNALSCADKVIIPVQSQYLAAKAMTQLMGTISRVKRQINPSLEVSGILLTLIDERTKLSKETCMTLQENYGNLIKIFDTKIPSAIKVAEATKVGKSIFNYEPKNKVALAYMNFAKEVAKDNGKSRKQNAPTFVR